MFVFCGGKKKREGICSMKKFARLLCLVLALVMVAPFAFAEDLGTIYRQHFGKIGRASCRERV